MAKHCIACGMPLEKPEHYPQRDESKAYCLHCARPDGSMKSYEEAKAGMTAFMVQTQGIDEQAAQAAVEQMMAKLPAWKEHGSGQP